VRGKLLSSFGGLIIACFLSTPLATEQLVRALREGSLSADLWITRLGEPLRLAPLTPYWMAHRTLNLNTLAYESPEGLVFHNPAALGRYALPPPRADWSQRSGILDGACQQASPLTAIQKRAIALLHEQAKPAASGMVWNYDYDTSYNDIVVKAPYPSAFAQAINIQALLFAYCKTKDRTHLDLAIKAGDAMLLRIEEGGVRNGDWFEEMPAPRGLTPYILNGHLYSVVVLYELAEVSGCARFETAAKRGTAAFTNLINEFDTGYWTRYDLRPRSPAVYVEIPMGPRHN